MTSIVADFSQTDIHVQTHSTPDRIRIEFGPDLWVTLTYSQATDLLEALLGDLSQEALEILGVA